MTSAVDGKGEVDGFGGERGGRPKQELPEKKEPGKKKVYPIFPTREERVA